MNTEDFKRGFLYAIADAGFTPETFGNAVLEKQAAVKQADLPSLANTVIGGGLIGLPLAAGYMGGKGLYAATKPDYETNIKALKNKELVTQLRLATRKLQDRQQQTQVENSPMYPAIAV